MTSVRVAAAQLQSRFDAAENLASCLGAIRAAADAGAALVVLPEASMVAFGRPLAELAEPIDGPFASAIVAAASESGITAVVGMFEPAAGGRVHNTALVAGPDGVHAYRKVHLFDAFGHTESKAIAAGEGYTIVDAAGVRLGLATCFDLRFADQFTWLGRHGAQIVAVGASWANGPGKPEQWDLLVRARAHDAQAWLVAAGQAWEPPGTKGPLGVGRSAVVDPSGAIRAQLGAGPGLLVHNIDLGLVEAVRADVPIL